MGLEQVLAAHAVAGGHGKEPIGLFLLAWGVFMSLIGWLAVTNFRGFGEAASRSRQTEKARRDGVVSPEEIEAAVSRENSLNRVIGGVFAVLGPIAIIVGIIATLNGHFAVPDANPAAAPIRYPFLAAGAIVIAWAWIPRRGGYLLAIARQSRRQCAAAILVTICLAVFAVTFAYGRLTIAFAILLASPLLAITLSPGNPRD